MPERTRIPSGPAGLRPAVLALALASAFGSQPPLAHAQALPTGGVAVHGQAVITPPAFSRLSRVLPVVCVQAPTSLAKP